jgi:glucose/arabinose dehydrogenase
MFVLSKHLYRAAILVALVLVVGIGIGTQLNHSSAQGISTGNYTLVPIVASGLERPVLVIEPDDGTGRLFILEQPGRIRIVEDGDLLDNSFLDITGITGVTSNERGLLGLALDPDFAENGLFYVNYTQSSDGDTIIARYSVSEDDPNIADRDSEFVIIEIDQPYGNHNGGMLSFGPDGYLYIGMGDGGSGGDPDGNAQNPQTLLGAMLRIDVKSDSEAPYTIPEDNPFADGEEGLPEIWAIGLRNPWRFSFDIETGDLYIGDVGQNQYEEVDFQPADSTGGENYGWNIYEASHSYEGATQEGTVPPIAEYGRSAGCSITGGYVYRGEDVPSLTGLYLYSDFCTGTVWWARQDDDGEWEGDVLFDTDIPVSSFGQDLAGEIYIVDHRGGVYLLTDDD